MKEKEREAILKRARERFGQDGHYYGPDDLGLLTPREVAEFTEREIDRERRRVRDEWRRGVGQTKKERRR